MEKTPIFCSLVFIGCNQMDKRYGWIILSRARGRSLNIQKACHFPKIVWCWPFSQFVRKLLHDLCGLSVILQQRLHKGGQLTHLLHLQRQKHEEYLKNRKKKLNMVSSLSVSCILLICLSSWQKNHKGSKLWNASLMAWKTANTTPNRFDGFAQHSGKKTRQVSWYILSLNTCVLMLENLWAANYIYFQNM